MLSRSSGASTDSVCRSSKLIVIEADSSPTMVQRVLAERPGSACVGMDEAAAPAGFTVGDGVIDGALFYLERVGPHPHAPGLRRSWTRSPRPDFLSMRVGPDISQSRW